MVLVDSRMARAGTTAEQETAGAWANLLEDLLDDYPPGESHDCSVLPVAVDSAAFALSERLTDRSFVRLDAHDRRHLEFHVALGCLRLMQNRPASKSTDVDKLPPSGITVFLSHAKRDLPREEWRGALAALVAAQTKLPFESWIDSSKIPVGATFPDRDRTRGQEGDRGRRRADRQLLQPGVVSREVFAAKAAARPIVVVDAIESQVIRLFPYIGNAPTVRWRAALAEATGADSEADWTRTRESWEAEDASTTLLVTLVESLRYRHERARLRRLAKPTDLVLGTHPEALTVAAAHPREGGRILYPDPPLGRDEQSLLVGTRPELDLVTPLERWHAGTCRSAATKSHCRSPAPPMRIAMADRTCTSRLWPTTWRSTCCSSACAWSTAGPLDHGASGGPGRAPGDDVNYVEQLMELVERYSPLAREVGLSLAPVENWVAWPIHEELTEEQRNQYRRNRAQLVEIERPNDLPIDANKDLQKAADGRYPSDTPKWRYVRARCMTKLREDSVAATSARVALGGKLHGYGGVLPGVAEEALLTLRADKPLYLLGGFGGASRAVLDVLRGGHRDEFTSAWCESNVDGWRTLVAAYDDNGTSRSPARDDGRRAPGSWGGRPCGSAGERAAGRGERRARGDDRHAEGGRAGAARTARGRWAGLSSDVTRCADLPAGPWARRRAGWAPRTLSPGRLRSATGRRARRRARRAGSGGPATPARAPLGTRRPGARSPMYRAPGAISPGSVAAHSSAWRR